MNSEINDLKFIEMKKLLFTISCSLILFAAFSQSEPNEERTEGIITYEEVMKLDIIVEGLSPDMMDMMPKENKNKTVLYFNESNSLYENLKEEEDASLDEMSGGGSVQIMMSQPENIIFRDLENHQMIAQTEFMTRTFLIESDIPKEDWKISGNQQMILGYPCQEAIKQDSNLTTKVWFTPSIPVSSGPDEFGNLPGMVLAVDINDGQHTLMAKNIEFTQVDEKKLKKPKKGKKVSREKYNSIVEEKTKEMGGEAGGGQTIIMEITK